MTVVRWMSNTAASSAIVAPAQRLSERLSTCGGVSRVCFCGVRRGPEVVWPPLSARFSEAATL
jgi:hypothetical protein